MNDDEAFRVPHPVTRFLYVTYLWARRCVVGLVGGTVIIIGIAMIVLPGPAIVVIPAGLAILGLEFAFARRWLRRVQETGGVIMERARFWRQKENDTGPVETTRKNRDIRSHPEKRTVP